MNFKYLFTREIKTHGKFKIQSSLTSQLKIQNWNVFKLFTSFYRLKSVSFLIMPILMIYRKVFQTNIKYTYDEIT